MIVERRSILKGLVALVAAPAIVKVASLMPVNAALQPGGPNYLTLQEITCEAMQLFTNNNAFIKQINDQYEADFAFINGEQWDTLRIRLPQDYVVTDDIAQRLSVQEPVDPFVYAHLTDADRLVYVKSRRTIEREFQVPAPLALAAAAVAVAPAVLKTPVTRRFWSNK